MLVNACENPRKKYSEDTQVPTGANEQKDYSPVYTAQTNPGSTRVKTNPG